MAGALSAARGAVVTTTATRLVVAAVPSSTRTETCWTPTVANVVGCVGPPAAKLPSSSGSQREGQGVLLEVGRAARVERDRLPGHGGLWHREHDVGRAVVDVTDAVAVAVARASSVTRTPTVCGPSVSKWVVSVGLAWPSTS